MMMKKIIESDRNNANGNWLLMNDLRRLHPDLERMLPRYPIELSAPGFFQVVSNIGEVDDLIAALERGLELYRRRRPKHRRPLDMKPYRIEKLAARGAERLRGLVAALQQGRDYIKKNLDYPLQCEINGMYLLFMDIREVDWIIGALKRKAREVEALAEKPWWGKLLAIGG